MCWSVIGYVLGSVGVLKVQRLLIPLEIELQEITSHRYECWEMNSGPLQEWALAEGIVLAAKAYSGKVLHGLTMKSQSQGTGENPDRITNSALGNRGILIQPRDLKTKQKPSLEKGSFVLSSIIESKNVGLLLSLSVFCILFSCHENSIFSLSSFVINFI